MIDSISWRFLRPLFFRLFRTRYAKCVNGPAYTSSCTDYKAVPLFTYTGNLKYVCSKGGEGIDPWSTAGGSTDFTFYNF